MLTLLLVLFALNVTTPAEMTCTDFVRESAAPLDIYVAGVEQEGMMTLGSRDQILYLNGPGVASLKSGSVQRVIRPEGKVRDPITGARTGIYHKDIGTVRIESVQQDSATARVLVSCQEILKGDAVTPFAAKTPIKFDGTLSDELTQIPQNGLVSSIMLGKDDVRQLAAGHLCFVGLGKRDGIAEGDRFTVFRPQPEFNEKDLIAGETGKFSTYASVRDWLYKYRMIELLNRRKLPPVILGDLVIVEAGESVSTGKIINSLSEMHPGDLIVKR